MARGVMKGRPNPALLAERIRIEGRLRMSAREIFSERAAVHAARRLREGGAS